MPRQLELRATFAGWKLPNGLTPLSGPFEIILEGGKKGKAWRYFALYWHLPVHRFMTATENPSASPNQSLKKVRPQIAKMFEKQLTDWK